MHQKSISSTPSSEPISTIELVQWPDCSSIDKKQLDEHVIALQTTRIAPTDQNKTMNLAYHGFNLGLHVGDNADQVNENRRYLQSLLVSKKPPERAPSKNKKIQWFEQVHGNNVAVVNEYSSEQLIADAAVTTKKNIGLAIMTADCLPILLVSKAGDEIAAIHGGWRPLAANIIYNTIEKMQTSSADLIAWLGPCISQTVFEIGQEVKAEFVQQDECFNAAFIEKNNGKYLADLQHIARIQLEKLGVEHISVLSECTYSNTEKYYSYRKHSVTGRMATLICLV